MTYQQFPHLVDIRIPQSEWQATWTDVRDLLQSVGLPPMDDMDSYVAKVWYVRSPAREWILGMNILVGHDYWYDFTGEDPSGIPRMSVQFKDPQLAVMFKLTYG